LNILLMGNGGREHALAWKLSQSQRFGKLWIAPGNPGTEIYGENISSAELDNPSQILNIVQKKQVDLVVIGPEGPLELGISDVLRNENIPVFGPSKSAAQLETSKSFANTLMREYGIDTAESQTFDSAERAINYVRTLDGPCVIKANGLAAGKGVTVCDTFDEAIYAINESLTELRFGSAGSQIVVEERMYGWETSAHAFTDGITVRHMPFSCDHKPVFDENKGPNTGGMGVYSSPPHLKKTQQDFIETAVTEKLVSAMAAEGLTYQGTIYPGMMLTSSGPRVVEINARFGDPETEALMPRLKSDLIDIVDAVANQTLNDVHPEWSNEYSVGVIMASAGYPNSFNTGHLISGIEHTDDNVQVFLAGTDRDEDNNLITAGGRVLCVVGTGTTLEDAREITYDNVNRITFEGAHFRTDIGSL
jgi:phosphoribosylamine--glycine ligase